MATNTVCSSCLRTLRSQLSAAIKDPYTPTAVRSPRHSLPRQSTLQRNFTHATRLHTTQPPHSAATAAAASPSSRPPPPPPPPRPSSSSSSPPSTSSPIANLAAQLRKSESLRSTTEPYIAYGGTEDLFLECSRQCSYTVPSALADPPADPPLTSSGEELGEGTGWWLQPKAPPSSLSSSTSGGLGLPTTFNTWAQVLFLHMWMLTVRLRAFPEKYVRNWHQNLLDHFFYAAEDRMATWHRMSARSERNKNLKELWVQWRGVLLSYDEGLIKGDAVLAAAVWRNVFKADPDVDIADLELVTAYVMRELQKLGRLEDEAVAMGRVKFADPREVVRVLAGRESEWMRKPVGGVELKALLEETRGERA